MPRTKPPYTPEFRHQMVELVRAGRSPEDLTKEFEPTAQSIRNWLCQADIDKGRRHDGLKTDEREDFGKSRGLVRSGDRLGATEVFEFVRANQDVYPVATMCRMLGVSSSGYYAWQGRGPCARARKDEALRVHIQTIHKRSRGTYGVPRVHAELRDQGVGVSRKRVARLMRMAGLEGVSRRKATRTTFRDRDVHSVPDLVQRDFSAAGPDRLWVADITYISTWTGFLYLAVVMDAFSRRVVGWAMANHLKTQLVLDALEMALLQRRPVRVVHHSDQGTQYTSIGFGRRCQEAGVRPSMGSAGDCYDNALCESFFATLECELLDRHSFPAQAEARMAVFEFIEDRYNPSPRHSGVEYLSPLNYERRYERSLVTESPNLSTKPG